MTYSKPIDGVCDHSPFLKWNFSSSELVSSLSKIGFVSVENCLPSSGDDTETIDLERQPYCSSDVFRCEKCHRFFFRNENNFKLIKREMIDIETIRPKHQIIIDNGNLDYMVFKNPDLSYAVSISKPVGIGIDVHHQLSEMETSSYLEHGILALSERLDDMDRNFSKYKVTSWR